TSRSSASGATRRSSGYGTGPARSSGTSSRARCSASGVPEMPGSREPVRTGASGEVLEITLDRPPANAVDVATSHALYEAFARLESDPGLRVGIVTAAGGRFFCAGWDLKAAAAGEAVDADHGPGGFAGLTQLHARAKPVIAAVNGIAAGGGFELVLAADLVVAAGRARPPPAARGTRGAPAGGARGPACPGPRGGPPGARAGGPAGRRGPCGCPGPRSPPRGRLPAGSSPRSPPPISSCPPRAPSRP